MDKEISALIKCVETVCPPKAEVEVVPIKDIYFLIVQLPPSEVKLTPRPDDEFAKNMKYVFIQRKGLQKAYFWEQQMVHNLHYEKILPVFGNSKYFVALYACDSEFVFYSQSSGVFGSGECLCDVDFIGTDDGQYFKYVGNCKKIDVLLSFFLAAV